MSRNCKDNKNHRCRGKCHGKCDDKKSKCCGEYVFNPKKREESPFSEYLLNTFTQAEVDNALNNLLIDPATP